MVPPPASAEQSLEKIKGMLRKMMIFHAIASVVSVVLGVVLVAHVAYFYPRISAVVTPASVAGALENVLITMGNVKNITTDVAFFADGVKGTAVALSMDHHPVRRALQEVQLTPQLQAAIAEFVQTLNSKTQTADFSAPGEFLRYVMGVDWVGHIAPRVDRGLASVQYAEVLAGAVLGALSQANSTTNRVQPPILN
jgi:hypothetical protein